MAAGYRRAAKSQNHFAAGGHIFHVVHSPARRKAGGILLVLVVVSRHVLPPA
jgi:hypothetical protein